MRKTAAAVLIVLFSACTGFAFAESAKPIPERFLRKWDGEPIWVSARAALTPEGSLRPGILHDHDKRELQRRRELLREQRKQGIAAADALRCDVEFVGYVSESGEPEADTFEALRNIAATNQVVTGRVTASAVGLHFGMPHTVLKIDSDGGTTYLMVPHGRMRLDGMTVCNADPRYSELPAIGDGIIAVVADPIDSTGTLYTAAGSAILYEHGSTVVVPPGLRHDPALRRFQSLDDLAATLKPTAERD